ncbi:DUF4115 domain-containing protein [SAR116 cluster bacterium]|nr:DUF4115 domain-containing protein [SAR116 cluster bacterium]
MSKETKETETDEDFIQSPGELLRQARLGKELSISEISRITRISKSMIQSLENGEVENLPGRTYETGYIKLICQVTNTNPDPIVKKWIDEYYFNKNPDPYSFPEPSSLQKRPIIANFGIILSVLIILSYSGWYFYSVNLSEETTSIPNKEEVNINLLTQYDNNNKTNSQYTDISDNKSSEENLSFTSDPKAQPSKLDKNEGFSEKLNKKQNTFDNITNSIEKSNILDVVENEIIENQTNSFDDNINNEDLSLSSTTSLSGNNENNDNLKIGLYDIENYENFSFVGIEDSWLQIISTEGEMFYTGMVKKGDNLIVPNDKRLLITLGNAGAIGVEILNFGVKPIGQSGEIIQAVNLNYILNKISFVD